MLARSLEGTITVLVIEVCLPDNMPIFLFFSSQCIIWIPQTFYHSIRSRGVSTDNIPSFFFFFFTIHLGTEFGFPRATICISLSLYICMYVCMVALLTACLNWLNWVSGDSLWLFCIKPLLSPNRTMCLCVATTPACVEHVCLRCGHSVLQPAFTSTHPY